MPLSSGPGRPASGGVLRGQLPSRPARPTGRGRAGRLVLGFRRRVLRQRGDHPCRWWLDCTLAVGVGIGDDGAPIEVVATVAELVGVLGPVEIVDERLDS